MGEPPEGSRGLPAGLAVMTADTPGSWLAGQPVSYCGAGTCNRTIVVVKHGHEVRSCKDDPQLERDLRRIRAFRRLTRLVGRFRFGGA